MRKLFALVFFSVSFVALLSAHPYDRDDIDAISRAAPCIRESEIVVIEFRDTHAARHFLGTKLDWPTVKDAINDVIVQEAMRSEVIGPFSGRIRMDGEEIEYRGFGFGSRINIGTAFEVASPRIERDPRNR